MKLTRKKLFAIALAGGLNAVLETQKCGIVTQTYQTLDSYLSRRQYEKVRTALTQAGIPIDEQHSQYVPGSKTLFVFLPEIHLPSYQNMQKTRITALDSAIDFSAIGLEGIVGPVNPQKLQADQDQLDARLASFLIPQFGPEPTPPVLPTDSLLLKLQKQRRHVDLACRALVHEEHIQQDLTQEHPRYKQLLDLEVAISHLGAGIPILELARTPGGNTIAETFEALVQPPLETRFDAPGRAYAALQTRAPKIGMENAHADAQACAFTHASDFKTRADFLATKIKSVRAALAPVEKNYSTLAPFAQFKNQLDEYLMSCDLQIKQFEEAIDSTLATSPTAALAIKSDNKTELRKSFKELIDAQRSRGWVQNLANYSGPVMIVGGSGHTASIFDAIKAKTTLVTAGRIELPKYTHEKE